jgi:hypothetical protein
MDEDLLKYKELFVGNLIVAVEEKHFISDVVPDEHRVHDIVLNSYSLDSGRTLNIVFQRYRLDLLLKGETIDGGWSKFSLIKLT